MNGFEEFIDFLASKGVKSFHIEMQESRPLDPAEKEARGIERTLQTQEPHPVPVRPSPAKHDIPVHRGEEPVPAIAPRTVQLVAVEELAAEAEKSEKQRLEKETAKTIARGKKDRVESEKSEQQFAAEKAIVTATQDRAKQPASGLTATQANASVKANAETTGAIAAEMIDPKKLYDRFCARITMDDGTFTVEERTDLIGRMGLDDLLRINNDFSLGLDTDKTVEDVREDVKNCFL